MAPSVRPDLLCRAGPRQGDPRQKERTCDYEKINSGPFHPFKRWTGGDGVDARNIVSERFLFFDVSACQAQLEQNERRKGSPGKGKTVI